jgi:hypothetical protein
MMKRLASRLTWWHQPHEHTAQSSPQGTSKPETILASTSTRGKRSYLLGSWGGRVPPRRDDEIRDIMREIPPDSAARNPCRRSPRGARPQVEIVTGGLMKKTA